MRSYCYLLVGLFSLFFVSCKDPDDIGEGLVPTPGINYIDTLRCDFKTVEDDSIWTSNNSGVLVGNYYDNQFGRKSTTIYTQFLLPTNEVNLSPADSLTYSVDSLMLYLLVTNYYGKYSFKQEWEIDELDSTKLDVNTKYYSDNSQPVLRSVLDTIQTIDIGENFKETVVAIRLSNALGNKFLNNQNPADMVDNNTFTNYFKGLRIRTKPVNKNDTGAVFTVNLEDAKTLLKLFYHSSGDTSQQNYSFIINNNSAHYYNDTRSEPDGTLADSVIKKVAETATNLMLIQADGGLQIMGKFGAVETLKPMALNRAILTVFVDENAGGTGFDLPPQLIIYPLLSEGGKPNNNAVISEVNYNHSEKKYEFNITSYLQNLIFQKLPNYGFTIQVSDNKLAVHRAVLGNWEHPTKKPLIELFYTKKE